MKLSPEQAAQIDEQRAARAETRRPTAPALEEVLYQALPALDHGFVRVVDYMGDDAAVVQAARVSYGKGTTKLRDDRGLIRYLMRHHHSTPFEMAEIKLHVRLPIFVARQWIRHRTANVNEISARYSILDREFYLPTPEALGVQSTGNRQGRGDAVPPERAAEILALLKDDAARCYDHYLDLLNLDDAGQAVDPGRAGVARELARMDLTLNYYTQWYWKIDLHNLLHFLRLRLDDHAQEEIRVYARVIADLVRRWTPHTWEAFADYRLHAASLSRAEIELVRRRLRGEPADPAALGLSPRELRELQAKIPELATEK